METTLTLGADLRSLRKSRGLTLEALSAQLGRSVGWLSQVERNISQLDEDGLTAIAKALDVSVTLFNAPTERPRNETGRIVRRNARRDIGDRVPGLIEELLSPDLTDAFEAIHSTFMPGAELPAPTTRETAELAIVISGKLDVWIGDRKFVVGEGDSFRVRNESLRWANPYDSPAVAIWIISPPVY